MLPLSRPGAYNVVEVLMYGLLQKAPSDSILGRARSVLYANNSLSLSEVTGKFLKKEHALLLSRSAAEYGQTEMLKEVSNPRNNFFF